MMNYLNIPLLWNRNVHHRQHVSLPPRDEISLFHTFNIYVPEKHDTVRLSDTGNSRTRKLNTANIKAWT